MWWEGGRVQAALLSHRPQQGLEEKLNEVLSSLMDIVLCLLAASTALQRHKVPVITSAEIKWELGDKSYPWKGLLWDDCFCSLTLTQAIPSLPTHYPWHLRRRVPISETASSWHIFYNPPVDRQEALPLAPYQTRWCAGICPKYKKFH